jgi:methylthioribose-1-phosphate isomerase
MVVAPVSTIDFTMDNGSQIEIEQRAASEFLPDCYVQEDGLINAWNPVDVLPELRASRYQFYWQHHHSRQYDLRRL